MVEVVLLSLSSTFLTIEFVFFDKIEYDCGRYSGLQMHLLGWALFLAWIDLTWFLADLTYLVNISTGHGML